MKLMHVKHENGQFHSEAHIFLTMSVPDGGYSRYVSCSLNQSQYSQCYDTDMFIFIRYIHYSNFLNNISIIKSKVLYYDYLVFQYFASYRGECQSRKA